MEQYCFEASESYEHEPIQVVEVKNIPILLNEVYQDELTEYDMASLNALMLVGQATSRKEENTENEDEDTYLRRLSLAYEKLNKMPKILIEEFGHRIKILDISNNHFENLDFLSEFLELTSLICDRNNVSSATTIPYLPKLELLWLNHCNIKELYPWANRLHNSCPNLKYLSLMGNSIAPSYLNGGNLYEYLQYRLFLISLFPKLVHLDDKLVTEDQRNEAQKMYATPFINRIVTKSSRGNLPTYFRTMTDRVSDFFSYTPAFALSKKNGII